MNTNFQIILLGIVLIILLMIIFWVFQTKKRLKKFFLGKKGKDLEEVMERLQKEIIFLQNSKSQTEKELLIINKKLKQSIRGLETIRFNPFEDQGSNQSFAISFLNEEQNGVVISSLYGRERMSIFAKPIIAGKSSYELTEEEKEVLQKANNNLHN